MNDHDDQNDSFDADLRALARAPVISIGRKEPTFAPGTSVGPYEIEGPLGAGGMGEVFLARDRRLHRQVAVKVLPPSVRDRRDRLLRFAREARAASSLNHPNLITVFDVGDHEGTPYMITELLEGSTLRELSKQEPLPLHRAAAIAAQIARALSALHDKRMIHRDLKPENIFVTRDGRVKILDFGLIKLLEPDPGEDASEPLSNADSILGTPSYMAPEQVLSEAIDVRADLFSFGSVLYEMVTRRRAFHGSSDVETMSLVLHHDPLADAPAIPPWLRQLLARCLQKDPSQRFESARELASYLDVPTGGMVVPASDNPGVELYATSGWIADARGSPDGTRIAFVEHPIEGDDGGALIVIDERGRRLLSLGDWTSIRGIAWHPSGTEIWFTAARQGQCRELWATTLNGEARLLRTSAIALTLFDVAEGGRALIAAGGSQLFVVTGS